MKNQRTKSAKDETAIVDIMMKKIEQLEDKLEILESRTKKYEEHIDMLTKELKRNNKDDKNCNKVGNIKCKECDIVFRSVQVLMEHINETHPKSSKCTHCDRTFDSWSKLETHLLTEHDTLEEFKCDQWRDSTT